MAVKNTLSMYNANSVVLTVNNVRMYGFAPGSTMAQISWDNDRVTVEVDSQGTPVPSQSNKDSATLTINLSQQSPSNATLLALTQSNASFPVDFRNGTEHWWGTQAYITKPAEMSDGDNAGNRAWTVKILHANFEAIESGY